MDENENDDDFTIEKKERIDEEMDITPMIDITFLLLIFFVVCSKFDPTQMKDIPDADNGQLVSAKDSAVIFICLLYTSPSPRDQRGSRMPSSA